MLGLCVFSVFSDEAIRNLSDVSCFGAAGGWWGRSQTQTCGADKVFDRMPGSCPWRDLNRSGLFWLLGVEAGGGHTLGRLSTWPEVEQRWLPGDSVRVSVASRVRPHHASSLLSALTLVVSLCFSGLPSGLSGKESTCQCRRCRFDPWVGTVPWRRAWQPSLVFLPGESLGERNLVGHSPWGSQKS